MILVKKNQDILEEFILKLGGRVKFIKVDINKLKNFPTPLHLKLPTYYRLLLLEKISERNVIYLDSDLIILGDILKIENLFKNINLIGAIEESGKDHFNAGVLLVKIKKYTEKEITRKCLEWISRNSEKINYADQDALNAMIKNDYTKISPEWNVTEGILFQKKIKYPNIVHFTGGVKPWNWESNHPYKRLWKKYFLKIPSPLKEGDIWRRGEKKITLRKIIKRIVPFRLKYYLREKLNE